MSEVGPHLKKSLTHTSHLATLALPYDHSSQQGSSVKQVDLDELTCVELA